ncbi:hypothetical protein [Paenibacillus sp. HB172176]|uniref:hypothetical protein n=1 Tax=Paenibacillus sp. HB172176 TaxID=2493690 RepID=UPI001438A474|nr:hypothetical protein [Paenibacillus sp. HB172176]
MRSNEVSVQQAAATIDNALRAIDFYIIKEIQSSPEISNFFDRSQRDNTYKSVFEPSEFIRDLGQNESLIDSIYFYRADDGMILTLKGMFTIDDFGDKAFIEDMLARPG